MRSQISIKAFCNALAPNHFLEYEDWEHAMTEAGLALDQLFRAAGIDQLQTVLDVACGIGTQALALANIGYTVSASDVSRLAAERA